MSHGVWEIRQEVLCCFRGDYRAYITGQWFLGSQEKTTSDHLWNNWDRQSVQASSLSFMTLCAVRSVTFLTAVTPLCDLPHSPKCIRLQSATGEIQPCKSPLPLSCAGTLIGTHANTHVCAHVRTRLLTRKHTVSISLPLTLSLSKYKQLSCRYLCKLNVCVWYSD